MKTVFIVSIWIAGVIGAAVAPVSASWERPLDARPEAVMTGGALIMVAFLLRRGLRSRRAKET